MYDLIKIDTQDVQNAVERAFLKLLSEKGLTYEKLAFLIKSPDVSDRSLKSWTVEGKTPSLSKALLVAAAADEFKPGLTKVFLDEVLKVIGFKAIPIGQSPEQKIADYLEIFAEAVRDGSINDLRDGNVRERAE